MVRQAADAEAFIEVTTTADFLNFSRAYLAQAAELERVRKMLEACASSLDNNANGAPDEVTDYLAAITPKEKP